MKRSTSVTARYVILLSILMAAAMDKTRCSATTTCDNTRTYLQAVLQQSTADLTYTTPTSGDNKCRMDVTCCTSTAESLLSNRSQSSYQQLLFQKLNATITECLDAPLKSTAATFIDASRDSTIDSLNFSIQSGGSSSFDFHVSLVNTFYNYVKNGVNNLDLSDLQTQFQSIYFRMFLLSFRVGLEQWHSQEIVTSDSFEECFYKNVFETFFGTTMAQTYNRIQDRFNLYLRYLWALKTGDEVLRIVLMHSLSADCKESLLRIDYCSQCSSHQGTLACHSLCLNSLRGCFVDLTEFHSAYRSYVGILKRAKDKLYSFDPFASLTLLNGDLNGIVSFATQQSTVQQIKSLADAFCNTQYTSSKRRRSSESDNLRARRQATAVPLMAIDDSVTCGERIVNMLQTLPEDICQESSKVSSVDYNCWNGSDIDSYWYTVPDAGRLDQLSNPELNVRADTGLLYKSAIGKLKNVSTDLDTCQDDPRECNLRLSGLTSPGDDDYNFGSAAQFQQFSELGFPDPQILSVIPVAPSSSIAKASVPATEQKTSTSTFITTSTSAISTTTSTTTSTTSSQAVPRPSITSASRPRMTLSTSSRRYSTTTNSGPQFTTRPENPEVPDPDKPKDEAAPQTGSGHIFTTSVSLLVSLILIISLLLL